MKKTTLTYSLIFLLTAMLGLWFRLFPLLTHVKGDAEEKATLFLIAQIRQNIATQVAAGHPGLGEGQAKVLAQQLFDEYLHKNGALVREQIAVLSKEISEKSDIEGRAYPYLLASDSFYYLGLTKRILEKGSISDQVRANKYFNELMLAPEGQWEPLNLHPYLGAALFRFLKLFDPSIDLIYAVSFTPLIITVFSIAAFIILCAQLGLHPLNTTIAASFFALAPIHMKRSMFAWYDNDPYNVFFPLLILNLFFLALGQTNKKSLLVFSGATVAAFGLYAYFWQGWIFMLAIVLGALAVLFLISLFRRNKTASHHLAIVFASISMGCFLLITALFGPAALFTLFQEGLQALKHFIWPQLSAWPDLYLSVAELNDSDNAFIIRQLGGLLFICLSCAGLIIGAYRYWKTKFYVPVTLMIFALFGLLITLGAQRFVLLMLIPCSLGFGIGLDQIFNLLKKLQERFINNAPMRAAALLLTAAMLLNLIWLPALWLKSSTRTLLNPIFNSTWDKTLLEIQERTPAQSIVTAWWSPGHFIKAVAQRAVTFDGASINPTRGYWVARMFLAPDEQRALGILRMLNTSGNKAVETFQSMGLDLSTSVAATADIISRPRREALGILSSVTKSPLRAEELLSQTHGAPPPSYILVYNEFVEHNILLKFVGNYNFKAIELLNKDPEKLKKLPQRNSPAFTQLLWTLVGGPSKYSGILAMTSRNDEQISFQENITINRASMIAHIDSKKYGSGFASSVFYLKDGQIIEKKLASGNALAFSVLLFEKEGAPNVALMDRELAKSMLVSLYFFDGAGYKYIKPFSSHRNLTGRTQIKVFEVDWAGFIEEFDG